ncbi:MAG TPA: tRNA (adenosine(37)-N6)-dimethylallyltransferase MiaA [Caulobacteraceae bacterium]|jgi:tRNA dimethylallyltransferase|nr:tRNA (adenosine(37)-N6)-dimethylallyltransferase MiaA [Caulobacteraceae bacterium]
MSHAPVWLIAGPTACGKSALALALARETDGEIVNADSMQLYADLRVLTARPSPADEAKVPHHLFGVADAAEAWSVGRWLTGALSILDEIAGRGRTAIVVGGTGLYFRALTKGLAAIPPVPAQVRATIQTDYDQLGEAEFRERLRAFDPPAARRIASADRQRLTRALEVFEATGRSLSDWQADTAPPIPHDAWSAIVLTLPRGGLYARIEARLDAMIANGARAEVAALMARGLDPRLPAMKALGVRCFAAELTGRLSQGDALAEAKAETRRYAKRQVAWFNHQAADWPRADARADSDVIANILKPD